MALRLGFSDAAVPTEPGVSSLESYELLDHQSLGSEEPYESALSGDTSHLYSHDLVSASEAVSKWQLKGKRNIRNINKRSLDAADGKTSIYGAYSEDKVSYLELTVHKSQFSFK